MTEKAVQLIRDAPAVPKIGPLMEGRLRIGSSPRTYFRHNELAPNRLLGTDDSGQRQHTAAGVPRRCPAGPGQTRASAPRRFLSPSQPCASDVTRSAGFSGVLSGPVAPGA